MRRQHRRRPCRRRRQRRRLRRYQNDNRESSLIMQTLQFDSGDVKFAKLQPRTRGHFCLLSEELCQEKTISLFEL